MTDYKFEDHAQDPRRDWGEAVRISVRVRIGKDLDMLYNHILSDIEWEQIAPPQYPVTEPADHYDAMTTMERRKRVIDMLSAKFAQAFTDAISKKYLKDREEWKSGT